MTKYFKGGIRDDYISNFIITWIGVNRIHNYLRCRSWQRWVCDIWRCHRGNIDNCLDYQMCSQEITMSGAGNGSCSFAEITIPIMTKIILRRNKFYERLLF